MSMDIEALRRDVIAASHGAANTFPLMSDDELHLLADPQPVANLDRRPIQPTNGQVLAGAAWRDRVALSLQCQDMLVRVERDGARRPAMVAPVALLVSDNACRCDLGAGDALLGHAAPRVDVDLNDVGGQSLLGHSAFLLLLGRVDQAQTRAILYHTRS